MDLKVAVDFVRSMHRGTPSDEEFTGTQAVVVSTISTIIQMASHVQELVGNCPEMRNMVLGLYGSVSAGAADSRSELVTLFGPRVEGNRGRSHDEIEQESGRNRNIANMAAMGSGGEGNAQEGIGIRNRARTGRNKMEATEVRNNHGLRTNRNTGRSVASLPIAPAPAGTRAPENEAGHGEYHVPEGVAAKCMSYLLDISGCTSHPRRCRSKDVDNINARLVQSAVKAIFKKHKEIISRRGVKSHGLQYVSLVPQDSQGKVVVFPKLCLSRSRTGCSFVREGELRTNLCIGKADRNRKEQNLALIASLIHHMGHGVDIEGILTQFARRGLGPEGCKLFGGCRAPSLRNSCKDSPKDDCLLYCEVEGERKVVGKGSPDPFLTFVLGIEVPPTAIGVRVKSVSCHPGLEKRRNDGCMVHENLYLWPKSDVGRVEFLGEFKDVLGSAIMVCRLYPDREEERSGTENPMNIIEAVLLCEVQLVKGKERERYPFAEWYNNAEVRKIRELQYETPKELRHVVTVSSRAMLWHSGRVREVDTK